MADCSELSKVITQIAMNLSTDPNVKDLNGVLAKMQELFPEIRRQDIVDAIVETTQGQAREADELLKKLREIRQEARNDKNLTRKVAELEQHLENGTVPTGQKKINKAPDAIQELRDIRDALKKRLAQSEPAQKEKIQKQIDELEQKISTGNIFPKAKPETTAKSKELETLEYKRDVLKKQIRQKIQSMKPKTIFEKIADPFNAARAIMTSFDLSAVLRQGGFIGMGNPIRSAKAIPDMFRAFASDKAQWRINNDILNRPNAPLYAKSKLYLAPIDETASLTKMEETFLSHWVNKIPGVRSSQRAYITFLNRLRADSFDAMAATLGKNGAVTQPEADAISNYINVATGRGGLGKAEGMAVHLGTIFFAPRYVASRFQLLAGQPLYQGTARTRAMVAKEYGKFLIGTGLVLALGLAAGGKIETDPRSSDFMKLRFGKTRVDFLTGLSQNIVLMSRLATGKIKTPITENVKKTNRWETLLNFGRYKLSPMAGTTADVMDEKNAIGEKTTPISVVTNLTTPIGVRDIYTAIKEQGVPAGTAISLLSILGTSVNTFDEPQRPVDPEIEKYRNELSVLRAKKEKGQPLTKNEQYLLHYGEKQKDKISELQKRADAAKTEEERQAIYKRMKDRISRLDQYRKK